MIDWYDWQEGTVECPQCGWRGTGKTAALAEMFAEGAEYVCPACGHDLGFHAFPTLDAMHSDPRADPAERTMAAIISGRLERHERTKLVSPDQLPDLEPPPANLAWDVVETSKHESDVVILAGERVIWRELSFYENYERFCEVAAILKRKYGPALVDLVPTRRSWLDLYGDRLAALDIVDAVRADMTRPDADGTGSGQSGGC